MLPIFKLIAGIISADSVAGETPAETAPMAAAFIRLIRPKQHKNPRQEQQMTNNPTNIVNYTNLTLGSAR
jgi:hypothetical protein